MLETLEMETVQINSDALRLQPRQAKKLYVQLLTTLAEFYRLQGNAGLSRQLLQEATIVG